MKDPASASTALGTFLQHIKRWSEQHPEKFSTIVSSLSMLSIAHLAARAEVHQAPPNPEVSVIAALMMQKAIARIDEASSHSVSNIFWAAARLHIRPDDMQAGAEEALGRRFMDTSHSAMLLAASNVLWSCGVLGLNPVHGLLRHLVLTIKRKLTTDFDSLANMQSLSVTMCAFATLRLHIAPSLAELILTRFYQGLVQGADEPQGLSNVLWACASLGYLPPPHMLQQFKQSYASSKKPFQVQHDSIVVWSLAVLGVLDMDYFKTVILRLPRQRQNVMTLQQLYQALQSLRPQDQDTPAYKDWAEVRKPTKHENPI